MKMQPALKRTLRKAFVYTPSGLVEDADLTIRCQRDPIEAWAAKIIATTDVEPRSWSRVEHESMEQSFRQLAVEDAISLL